MDVTPSRGVGPFDAKQAQEWRDAAELLCAQSRYAEAEKLYVKLLEEREHALGLNSPELGVGSERPGPGDVRANEISTGDDLLRAGVADHGNLEGQARFGGRRASRQSWPRSIRHSKSMPRRSSMPAARWRWSKKSKGPDAPELAPSTDRSGRRCCVREAVRRLRNSSTIAPSRFSKRRPELATSGDAAGAGRPGSGVPRAASAADAEAAWRRALSIRESAYGPSTIEVADTLDRLGKFYYDQKNYPEAAYCYERTLFIRRKRTATWRRTPRRR